MPEPFGPRERPGRDPEAEADRLRARFRAVSRRIDRTSPRPRRPRAVGPRHARALAVAAILAVALFLAFAG